MQVSPRRLDVTRGALGRLRRIRPTTAYYARELTLLVLHGCVAVQVHAHVKPGVTLREVRIEGIGRTRGGAFAV